MDQNNSATRIRFENTSASLSLPVLFGQEWRPILHARHCLAARTGNTMGTGCLQGRFECGSLLPLCSAAVLHRRSLLRPSLVPGWGIPISNVRSAECKLPASWPEPTSAEKAAASSRTPNRGTPQQLTLGSQSFSDLCFLGAFWYRFHSSNEWQFPWRSHETSDLCDDQWQAADRRS